MAGRSVARCPRLPDVLAPGLGVVFVGINPSLASGRAGHHFASPGNPFWRLLHASAFTPELLRPDEDARVLEYGLGLTNVCARPTGAAAELTRREYEVGVRELLRKLEAVRPAVVALVGVTLARLVLPHPIRAERRPAQRTHPVHGERRPAQRAGVEPGTGRDGEPEVGPGPRSASLAGARVFVLPNPSGRNAAYPSFDSKLEWFMRLREFVSASGGGARGSTYAGAAGCNGRARTITFPSGSQK